MGKSLSYIIRHHHRLTGNAVSDLGFVRTTMEQLRNVLQIGSREEDAYLYYQDFRLVLDEEEVAIELPVYDCKFIMHRDFWEISPGRHYDELFLSYEGRFMLREIAYDLARVLGENEVWYAEQRLVWDNNLDIESTQWSWVEWVSFVEKYQGTAIPEFDALYFSGLPSPPKSYSLVYHDVFVDCKFVYHQIKSELSAQGYDLLGLHTVDNGRLKGYRCLKGGRLVFVPYV